MPMSVLKKFKSGVKVVHQRDHELWQQCERLEYDVFSEAGYLPGSDNSRIDAFDGYKKMEFIAVLNDTCPQPHIERYPFRRSSDCISTKRESNEKK